MLNPKLNLTKVLYIICFIIGTFASLCLLYKGFILSSLTLLTIYLPVMWLNSNNKFIIFFYLYVSIFYIQRIIILTLAPTEFWYSLDLYNPANFAHATIYTILLFSAAGMMLKILSLFLVKNEKLLINNIDKNLLKIFIAIFIISTFLISLTGGVVVGYTIPAFLRFPVRILQFLAPLGILIFAPFFSKKIQFLFVILLATTAYFIGSKAIVYNFLLSIIICKFIFENQNLGLLLPATFLIAIISAPAMFLTSNYIRYPEEVGNISLFSYILRDYSFSIYSTVSHRFANFDTLTAFIVKADLNNFKIQFDDYLLEMINAINRFIPGNFFEISKFFMSFEEKSAYELRGITISQIEGVGRHTESLALAKYYLMGLCTGSVTFLFLIATCFLMTTSGSLIINVFAYLFMIEVLTGSDMQSLLVLPFNLIVLIIFYNLSKIAYVSLSKPLRS